MKSSNLVIFNGYVGVVGETKVFGETTIKEISISIQFKNKTGDKRTLWKNCKMFNKTVELFGDVQKGDFIKVIGEMDVDVWTGNDGQLKSKEIVIVDTIEWVSFHKQSNDTHPGNVQASQIYTQQPQEQSTYQRSQYAQPSQSAQSHPQQCQFPFDNEEAKGDLPF